MNQPKNPMLAHVSLQEARQWLRERVDDGSTCPCCHQFAKVYRRRIHATIARGLIDMHLMARPDNDHWVHVPTSIGPACEVGKARYWGLVEEAIEIREDGGRAGWWRLTPEGVDWVKGRSYVHLYARIYNGRCLGLEGVRVHILDALGSKFDYNKLMAGEA